MEALKTENARIRDLIAAGARNLLNGAGGSASTRRFSTMDLRQRLSVSSSFDGAAAAAEGESKITQEEFM